MRRYVEADFRVPQDWTRQAVFHQTSQQYFLARSVDLEAVYSGDGTYASSTSSAVSYQITTGTTPSAVTGIGATPNSPVLVGTTVTITATVTSGATGTVDFEYSKDGVTFTGITGCSSQTVSSNSASCVTAQVPVGTLYLDAVYSGDGTYESATGTAYSYHVISGSTTSSVAISSIAPGGIAVFGTSVTISAVVNAGATGTVEIESSLTGVTYSPVSGCTITPIASNTSTCQTTSLPLGTADLEAVYSGDATYAPSTSAVLPYSVRYASTAALTGVSPASSATYASPVTITATVITGATGTVAFEASTNNASFSNLSDCASVAVSVATHTATCTTLVLPTGLDYLKALYSGDLNYAPVTTKVVEHHVNQRGDWKAARSYDVGRIRNRCRNVHGFERHGKWMQYFWCVAECSRTRNLYRHGNEGCRHELRGSKFVANDR